MKDNTWKYGTMKYGTVKLSSMTYTFKCDNEKCGKSKICLLSKYDKTEFFGRCNYCGEGRLKWIENINLQSVLREHNFIQTKKV